MQAFVRLRAGMLAYDHNNTMPYNDHSKTLIAALCGATLLAGCGAGATLGTAGAAPAAPTFLNFNENANGTVVTTGNGTVQFLTNDHLYSQNQEITNVVLNASDSTVTINGAPFGRLALVATAAGTKIAVFVCTNNNYATITGTNLGCGSTSPFAAPNGSGTTGGTPGGTTTGGTPTGGNSGNTGGGTPTSGSSRPTVTPLSGCVSAVQNPQVYNWMDVKNSCGQPILVAWGFADMSAGTGSWHILTGGHYQTGDTYKDYQAHGGYKYFVCPEGYSPVNPTTHSYVSVRDTSYTCIKS